MKNFITRTSKKAKNHDINPCQLFFFSFCEKQQVSNREIKMENGMTSGYHNRLRVRSQRKCHRQENCKDLKLNFIIAISLDHRRGRNSKRYHGKVEEGGTIAGKGAEGDVRGSFSKYADLTERAIHVQKTDHPETGRKRGLRDHRTIRGLYLKGQQKY